LFFVARAEELLGWLADGPSRRLAPGSARSPGSARQRGAQSPQAAQSAGSAPSQGLFSGSPGSPGLHVPPAPPRQPKLPRAPGSSTLSTLPGLSKLPKLLGLLKHPKLLKLPSLSGPPRLAALLGFCLLFFVAVPGAIYLLSYAPYTKVPGAGGGLFKTMLDSQASMFDYHSTLKDTHPFESAWWSWPIMAKPIWYYMATGLEAGMKAGISSFGNPLVWWVGIPCLAAALIIACKKGDRHMAPVFAGFLFQYCPWIFISRATFIYHYFSAVPFVIFSIVYVMKDLADARVLPRKAAVAYLAATALLFALYYPVLSGLPVSVGYSDGLRLFSSWTW
ncbi:MAG: hypothetical protein LBL83_08050, partial [Clostridiales bacterium]|nr:hypothetical protein [Clostridiales bacterium]